MTNINFLLKISMHCWEKWLSELISWSRVKNALIFYQILSTIPKGNVRSSVWRIWISILELKGFIMEGLEENLNSSLSFKNTAIAASLLASKKIPLSQTIRWDFFEPCYGGACCRKTLINYHFSTQPRKNSWKQDPPNLILKVKASSYFFFLIVLRTSKDKLKV